MMYSNAIALILALAPTTILAAPTQTFNSLANLITRRNIPAEALKALQDGSCDLDGLVLPVAPTPLPAPGAGLKISHIALGRGTQNYTCLTNSSTEAPTQVGAIATLYNATCEAVRAPVVFNNATVLALNYAVPTADNQVAASLMSGHHFFTASGSPYFYMDTANANYGWIQAAKNGTSTAPDGSSKGTNELGSVPWLKLTSSVPGTSFKEVYRVETAGGVAPKTCDGMAGSFNIDYSAQYWFYA